MTAKAETDFFITYTMRARNRGVSISCPICFDQMLSLVRRPLAICADFGDARPICDRCAETHCGVLALALKRFYRAEYRRMDAKPRDLPSNSVRWLPVAEYAVQHVEAKHVTAPAQNKRLQRAAKEFE